jgi:hypothetical protein
MMKVTTWLPPGLHTPGELTTREGDGRPSPAGQGPGLHRGQYVRDERGIIVAQVFYDHDHPGRMEADARLFAAANQLLAACERAKASLDIMGLDWLGEGPDPLEAAIAKAKGG